MLGSSISVSLFSLLVSVASFANQLVLAGLFGVSMAMDAYLIAVSIPMLVSGIFSGALSYSLVPLLVLHKSDFSSYRRISGLLLMALLIMSVIISSVGFIAAPAQIAMLGELLSFSAQQDAIEIARISWMTNLLILVVSFLGAMHNVAGRFMLPVLTSLVPVVGMIVAGILFAPLHGPLAVTWGMFVGFLLIIPVLLVHTLPALDISTKCLLLWKEAAGYLIRLPLIVLAMLCFTVFQSIDSYWAPQIGIGNLAFLGYSQRILVALGGLVVAGPAAVILPRLAAAYADGRSVDLLKDTQRAVHMVIAFSLPVVMSVSLLAQPLVRLLFERGAFDRHATQGVASILPLMMVGMMAMLCVVIIFRALYAKHDIVRASLLGIFVTVAYFCLSGLLSEHVGVEGIAIAYALTWWSVLLVSALVLWRGYLGMLFCKESLLYFGQLIALTAVIGAVLVAGKAWIIGNEVNAGLLIMQTGFVVAAAVAAYFVVAIRVFGIEDVRLIYAFVSATMRSINVAFKKL